MTADVREEGRPWQVLFSTVPLVLGGSIGEAFLCNKLKIFEFESKTALNWFL